MSVQNSHITIKTKSALVLADHEVGLTPDQVQRWDRNQVKLADPKAKQQAKDEALRSTIAIEGLAAAERDKRWREGAAAETIQLARDRGEDIDAGTVSADGKRRQPMRRLTSGGLHEAFRRGTLGEGSSRPYQLLHIGDLYRDCYERDTSMTTPERSESMASGAPKMAQSVLLHASQVLAVLRAGMSELEVNVLDQVCGQDVNLKIATKVIGKRPTTISAALRSGLDRAADNWLGKEDDAVRPKAHWDGLSAAIAKAQRSRK